MAKTSGIGFVVAVDDSGGTPRTISNDITNLTLSTPRATQDVTGLDKLAHELLVLLADASETLNMAFNPAADSQHDVFKTVPSTSVQRTVTNTIAAKVLALELLFTDYSLTRAADGGLSATAPGQIANGATVSWA